MRYLFPLIGSLLLTGCGTRYKEAAANFHAAADPLPAQTEIILTKAAQLDLQTRGSLGDEMNRLSAVPSPDARLQVAQRTLDSVGPGLYVLANELETTRAAVRAVNDYATALDHLANGSNTSQIRASSEKLVMRLTELDSRLGGKLKLNDPAPNLKFTRGELLGGLVRFIGNHLAERKRAYYTGLIARAVDPILREIGKQLEFQMQIAERFIRNQYATQYDRELRPQSIKLFDALVAARKNNDASEMQRVRDEINVLEERMKMRLSERDAQLTDIKKFRSDYARILALHVALLQTTHERDFASAVNLYLNAKKSKGDGAAGSASGAGQPARDTQQE